MITREFKLKDFDGPLDLLLTLIGKAQIDIKDIFVDGILKIGGRDYAAFGTLLEKLDKLTGEEATVVFTVSADDSELPESVKQFIK